MDVPNRDQLEAELARVLARQGRNGLSSLMAALGDPPNLANLPADFWTKYDAELQKILMPYLIDVFHEQAETMIGALPSIGVDWALINQAAIDWAKAHTFELVRGITQTTMRTLQTAVSSFFQLGLTREQLEAMIRPLYGPVRTETIVVTEITRAANWGEGKTVQELARQGIFMDCYWGTNNDELVCLICNPLNERKADEYTSDYVPIWIHPVTGMRYGLDPAHPRCRCHRNWRLRMVPHA